jgi:hypothetical protein
MRPIFLVYGNQLHNMISAWNWSQVRSMLYRRTSEYQEVGRNIGHLPSVYRTLDWALGWMDSPSHLGRKVQPK